LWKIKGKGKDPLSLSNAAASVDVAGIKLRTKKKR
jgi:hypothetical protein